jgi:hypothetical protein
MIIEWHYAEGKFFICVGVGDSKGDGTVFVFNVKPKKIDDFQTKRVWGKEFFSQFLEFHL